MSKKIITLLLIIMSLFVVNINRFDALEGGDSCIAMLFGYHVEFETNGGTHLDSIYIYPGDVQYAQILLPTPERYGYTFEGWYADPNFSTPVNEKYAYSVGKYFTMPSCDEGHFKLYAKWSRDIPCNSGIYTIKYVTNGGKEIQSSSQCLACGMTNVLPTPERSGYKFEGWYADANLQHKIEGNTFANVLENNYVAVSGCDSTHTIYAKWADITTTPICPDGGSYKVRFVTNGGKEISTMTQCIGCNTNYTLPTPERSGYKFEGWYRDAKFKNKINGNKSSDTIYGLLSNECLSGKTFTIYAKWSIKQTEPTCPDGGSYKIKFNTNGGKSISTMTQCIGCNTINTLPTPERKGYKFVGWYKDANFGTKVNGTKASDAIGKLSSNECLSGKTFTIYAKWEPVFDVCPDGGSYTITMVTNGGKEIKPISQCIGCNTITTIPTPERKGYTFEGWYKDPNFGTKIDGAKASDAIYGLSTDDCLSGKSFAIYAKWSKKITNDNVTISSTNDSIDKVSKIKVKEIENKRELNNNIEKILNNSIAYDIELLDENNNEVQAKGKYKLSVVIPQNIDKDKLVVYSLIEGELSRCKSTIEGSLVSVEAERDSIIILGEDISVVEVDDEENDKTLNETKKEDKSNNNIPLIAITATVGVSAAGITIFTMKKKSI